MAIPAALMAAGLGTQAIGTIGSLYLQYKAAGQMEKANQLLQDALSGIPLPELEAKYSTERIDPAKVEMVGEYAPEIAPFVEEKTPETLEETAITREGMEAQRSALDRLRRIAAGEPDPALDAQLDIASRQAQEQAQTRSESLLQDMARRGTLGSGVAAMAQQEAGLSAMSDLAAQGDIKAIESYRNQLQSLRDAATLGRDIRGQDYDIQAANKDVINAYNQRASQDYQNWLATRASELNKAQLQNLGERQRIHERNVLGEEAGAVRERGREDVIEGQKQAAAQQHFENQMRMAQAQSGAVAGQAAPYQQYGQMMGQAGAGLGQGMTAAGLGMAQHQMIQDYYGKQPTPFTPAIPQPAATPAAPPVLAAPQASLKQPTVAPEPQADRFYQYSPNLEEPEYRYRKKQGGY